MSRVVRVLLVEDNPGDAELTRDTLEECRLHLELEVATDGAAAVARLLGDGVAPCPPPPDLVLLDLNLPKIDGAGVLARIRAEPSLRTLPVVVLTSSEAEQDIARSYELGANCYVTKPVGLAAFQKIVRTIDGFWLSVVKLP